MTQQSLNLFQFQDNSSNYWQVPNAKIYSDKLLELVNKIESGQINIKELAISVKFDYTFFPDFDNLYELSVDDITNLPTGE